jgi:hypothetical protein
MVRRAREKAAGRGPESARKWSDGSAATTGASWPVTRPGTRAAAVASGL